MFSQKLPAYYCLWIGWPSNIDPSEQKILGQDCNAAIELQKWIENEFFFVCLEQFQDHFKALFAKNGVDIKIKTAESMIEACKDSKDDFLKACYPKIRKIYETYLKRGTKRDFVSLKELISLLVIYQGNVTADSNVRFVGKQKFSIPAYHQLLAPDMESQYDIWMMYSPPQHENIKSIITFYLENWDRIETYLTEENDEAKWNGYQSALVYTPLKNILGDPPKDKNYPWKTSSDGLKSTLSTLPLEKVYQGTHRIKKDIGELLYGAYLEKQLDLKSICWSNCKEALKIAICDENPPDVETAEYFLTIMSQDPHHRLENSLLSLMLKKPLPGTLRRFASDIEESLKNKPEQSQEFFNDLFDIYKKAGLKGHANMLQTICNEIVSKYNDDKNNAEKTSENKPIVIEYALIAHLTDTHSDLNKHLEKEKKTLESLPGIKQAAEKYEEAYQAFISQVKDGMNEKEFLKHLTSFKQQLDSVTLANSNQSTSMLFQPRCCTLESLENLKNEVDALVKKLLSTQLIRQS